MEEDEDNIDTILTLSFFFLFGMQLRTFANFYSLAKLSALLFVLRRLLPTLIGYALFLRHKAGTASRHRHFSWTLRQAVFIGWFAPIGIGCLHHGLNLGKYREMLESVVVSSVVLHGLTVPLFHLGLKQVIPLIVPMFSGYDYEDDYIYIIQ